MAETPDVSIRFRVTGSRRIDQAINGVRTTIQKAQKAQAESAKKNERTVSQSAKRRATNEKKYARQGADEVEKAERRKRKAFNATTREELKNDRVTERIDRNNRRRRRRGGRGGGMLAGMAAVGGAALVGARMAGSTAQGIVGVRGQGEMVSAMIGARANLVRNIVQGLRGSNNAAMMPADGEMGSFTNYMVGRATQIGVDRGVSSEGLMNAIAASQTEFSSLADAFAEGKDGIDRLMAAFDSIAMVSQATGTSIESTSRATFALMSALDIGADQVDQALGIIAQQALDGSISLDDFANQFPEILSTFRGSRGTSGLDALKEFSGLIQALQSGARTSPEKVRTGAEAFMRDLSTERVQRALREERVETIGADGNLRNIGDIVADLTARGMSSTELNSIFSGEAGRAAMQLMGAERTTMTMNERIQGASAEDGIELLQQSYGAVMDDAVGAAYDARAEREARMANESERLIEAFSELAGTMGALEDRFPILNTLAGSIGGVGATIAGAFGLKAMMGGGAAAGGGGLMAGMKGLFSVAGAGALAAKGAVIGAGTVVGGALGYGIGGISDAIEGTRGTSSGLQAAQREAFGLIDFQGGLVTAIVEGFREINAGPTLPERPSERGNRTVEIGRGSINAIAGSIAANAPGSGRREEGGPTER